MACTNEILQDFAERHAPEFVEGIFEGRLMAGIYDLDNESLFGLDELLERDVDAMATNCYQEMHALSSPFFPEHRTDEEMAQTLGYAIGFEEEQARLETEADEEAKQRDHETAQREARKAVTV